MAVPRPGQHCQGHQERPRSISGAGATTGLSQQGQEGPQPYTHLLSIYFLLSLPFAMCIINVSVVKILIFSISFISNNLTLASGVAHTSQLLPICSPGGDVPLQQSPILQHCWDVLTPEPTHRARQ